MHRGAHAVTVTQIEVVPHANLVPVVNHRCSRERKEQPVHQLNLLAVIIEQRGQTAADAQIDAGLGIISIDPVHIVPLFIGNHLQGQFIVVAQEKRPLAGLRDGRRLLDDINDGEAVFHTNRHKQTRHEGKVVGHMALISVAKVSGGVFRPLVGLGEQHPVLELAIDVTPYFLEESMGLRQVLAVGALPLVEVGDGIQAKPVHPQVKPEGYYLQNSLPYQGIIIIEVGLVRVEAVPVVGLGHRVPGPVG